MPALDHPEPRAFAREHHLAYDVTPEDVSGGGERAVVGLDIRLFATHEGEKLRKPGCARCLELLAELRHFAERLVEPAERRGEGSRDVASRIQIVPEPGALYQSPEDAGKDEVSLTIRVTPLTPGPAEGDPAFVRLREGLAASGVARRS